MAVQSSAVEEVTKLSKPNGKPEGLGIRIARPGQQLPV